MTGTRFLCVAYDESMETLLILILLFAMRDPAMRDSLNSALAFYRENRDLIAMLTNAKASAPTAPEETDGQEKSRPHEEIGVSRILEEYLGGLK